MNNTKTAYSQQNISNFLEHLQKCDRPFILRIGQPPEWNDAEKHIDAYQQNPEMYALLAAVETVKPEQRMRILFQLLQSSRKGMEKEVRQTLWRVTALLLAILHPDSVLTVFLALRRVRANHKHTTRAILKYIFNHPQMEDMALRRRPALVDVVEHALGKNVVRGSVKQLTAPVETSHPRLLRYTDKPEQVKVILPLLYPPPLGIGLVPAVGEIQYKQVHEQYTTKLKQHKERPSQITATNRGDIAATLVHIYRGGTSEELLQALEQYVQQAAAKLPKFNGRLALVLDVSASTKSYGDRSYCCLAQSVALKLVLEKCCTNLTVYTVGGSGHIPMPEGNTDLASTLIDALENNPDLVAIVSDGYENVYPDDLARVVATLPNLGILTPVVFCHSKFTNQDDLELRRPATNLPQLEFWHQDDFEELLLSFFFMVNSPLGEAGLRQFLLEKLELLEKEMLTWTANN